MPSSSSFPHPQRGHCGLETLPTELLLAIVNWPGLNKKDWAALRLTCSTIESAARTCLFRTVVLSRRARDRDNFFHIAATESLASQVQELVWAWTPPDPSYYRLLQLDSLEMLGIVSQVVPDVIKRAVEHNLASIHAERRANHMPDCMQRPALPSEDANAYRSLYDADEDAFILSICRESGTGPFAPEWTVKKLPRVCSNYIFDPDDILHYGSCKLWILPEIRVPTRHNESLNRGFRRINSRITRLFVDKVARVLTAKRPCFPLLRRLLVDGAVDHTHPDMICAASSMSDNDVLHPLLERILSTQIADALPLPFVTYKGRLTNTHGLWDDTSRAVRERVTSLDLSLVTTDDIAPKRAVVDLRLIYRAPHLRHLRLAADSQTSLPLVNFDPTTSMQPLSAGASLDGLFAHHIPQPCHRRPHWPHLESLQLVRLHPIRGWLGALAATHAESLQKAWESRAALPATACPPPPMTLTVTEHGNSQCVENLHRYWRHMIGTAGPTASGKDAASQEDPNIADNNTEVVWVFLWINNKYSVQRRSQHLCE